MIENRIYGTNEGKPCSFVSDLTIEPDDTIETIAQYTHFTAKELCDLLGDIIKESDRCRPELDLNIYANYKNKKE